MSYNSCFIAYKNSKNIFRGIFVFNNGAVENTGEILRKNYRDAKDVLKLISLGDLLELGKNSSESISLKRDRNYNKDSTLPIKFNSLEEIFSWCMKTDYLNVNYIYLFIDNKWHVTQKGFFNDKQSGKLLYLKDYHPPILLDSVI